uniref:Putative reverse transcriptase-rnase h-integrase n=1 Tax=Moniliophthora roreri TaxID=221103 RepID=A0A0W0FTD6_MONRR
MNIKVEEEEEVKEDGAEVEERYQRIMGNRKQRRKWWKEGILEDTTDELWVAAGVTYSAELAYEESKKKEKRSMEEIVPAEFHKYRKVFSEEESYRAKYFTKLDVRWGYNNVRIKKGDKWKAAFVTNRGLFEPQVMFFGLTNSPATFQALMNSIFADLIAQGKVAVYLDDILIYSTNLEEHHQTTHEVLKRLQENDLYLHPEKCKFDQEQVEYLGMVIREGVVSMDPVKVRAVKEWATSRNLREL